MSEHEDAAVPRAGRSFRPGDWFGIFGEHATVVLPPSEKARVAAVWALVDSGAGFDEVLDALIATGLRDLPGFVLVSEDGEDTKVVIRGAAHAEFTTAEETVTVEGSSATTWAERSLTGVRAMRIEVAAAEDGAEDLAIRDGLVRISRTDRPAVSSPATTPAPVQEEEEDRTLDPTPAPESQPERKPEPEPDPEPDPEPEPEPVIEAPGQESPLDDPPTHRHELSATEEAGWSQPAPLPQPAAAPIAAAWATPPDAEAFARHDGPTQAGNWDPGALAPAPPGIPGQPAAPGVLASPVARLTFSSGEVVDVDRAVIVGRAPEARRLTPTDEPRLVPVPSPHQEISATHLEIRPGAGADHGSAVATDLGSTNGTVLVQPGLPAEDLQPGIAVQLIPGAILDLGDGVTIQVGHA